MSVASLLRAAYGVNVVILLPVVVALIRTRSPAAVFGPHVPDSPALRSLVTALWGGILVCSALGLMAPHVFIGVLVLQVVYKAAWLAGYVYPTWRLRGPAAVPWGPAAVFLAIVVLWPLLLGCVWLERRA